MIYSTMVKSLSASKVNNFYFRNAEVKQSYFSLIFDDLSFAVGERPSATTAPQMVAGSIPGSRKYLIIEIYYILLVDLIK